MTSFRNILKPLVTSRERGLYDLNVYMLAMDIPLRPEYLPLTLILQTSWDNRRETIVQYILKNVINKSRDG